MKPQIIYFRETFFQSVCADICTWASLFIMFWLNKTFLGSSHWVSFCMVVIFIFMIVGVAERKKRVFTSYSAAIAAIQKDWDAASGKKAED